MSIYLLMALKMYSRLNRQIESYICYIFWHGVDCHMGLDPFGIVRHIDGLRFVCLCRAYAYSHLSQRLSSHTIREDCILISHETTDVVRFVFSMNLCVKNTSDSPSMLFSLSVNSIQLPNLHSLRFFCIFFYVDIVFM